MPNSYQKHSRLLGLIVVLGLLPRVFFLLYGSRFYYHDPAMAHLNGDSTSYMWSFENLWLKGHYSFDFLEPDAAFGRLPGYPLFYGLHYLVFGAQRAAVATICTQTLLDTACVVLVYHLVRRLAPAGSSAPLLGALLYALYPFIIVWMPVIGTETLSTDLTLLWLYLLVSYRPTALYAAGTGLLVAVCFFVREYLGVLLPITVGYLLLLHLRQPAGPRRVLAVLRYPVLAGLGFAALYLTWPIRNYLGEHRLVLVKPKTAGYANYTPDVESYYHWVHAWSYDENRWLAEMLGSQPIRFPQEAVETPADAAEAQRLVALARTCGYGFYVRRTSLNTQPTYRDTAAMRQNPEFRQFRQHNCNAEISAGFAALERRYAERHPWKYRFAVPLQNLQKAFFKSDIVVSPQQGLSVGALLLKTVFGYRTVLLLLGLAGLVRRWQFRLLPIAVFFAFMYLFISFVLRGLEMRYLLQADALLLVPAALLLGYWLDRWLATARPRPASAARPALSRA